MAARVTPVKNDPAVKSVIKTTVMFNDVEYQVPTKVKYWNNTYKEQNVYCIMYTLYFIVYCVYCIVYSV